MRQLEEVFIVLQNCVFRPEMGENMTDSFVDNKVFEHFRFLEKVIISTVEYIESQICT